MTEATPTVIGPNDLLVLVTRQRVTAAEVERMQANLPDAAVGRVLIVEGSSLDPYVVRGEPGRASTPIGFVSVQVDGRGRWVVACGPCGWTYHNYAFREHAHAARVAEAHWREAHPGARP